MTMLRYNMKIISGVGGLLIAAVASGAALAQQPAAPQTMEVVLVHVKPGQEQAYQDWLKNTVNPVRIKGGVKERGAWSTSLGPAGEFYFVSPITGVSSYDTPPSNQPEAAAVFEKLRSMVSDARTYLITARPALSVEPKPGFQPKVAVLSTQNVSPGRVAAYTTNLKALTAVIAKTNAKGVLVSQTGLGGDPNEFNVLVMFDSFADLDRFPAEFAKASTAAKLPPEAAGIVGRTNYRVLRYRPELSIVPAP
jgi:antibiotic biosynthesis monooxygenase (ABM) superfamily enzyme